MMIAPLPNTTAGVAVAATRGALGARRLAVAALPVIDIGPLFRRDIAARRRVADSIGQAAHETGFFYVTNPVIPRALIDGVHCEAERFFSQPVERKLPCYIARSHAHRGFVPVFERGEYADETTRLYEAFDLALDLDEDDPDYDQGHRLLGPNVWPTLPGFREVVYAYYRAVAELGETLCRAFELHLRLAPGYFRQFMRKPTSQLRLLHYLPNDLPRDSKDMQMGAHTDYEAFTILHQGRPGLQVLARDNAWIEAPPIDGTFVINIGDLMEVWTNGQFYATPHRVVNTGVERYSMPYFCAADFDAVIEPVPTALGQGTRRRYGPMVAGHHLLGQLLRDFAYLRRRVEDGRLPLPFAPCASNPFEKRLAQSEAA